MIQSKEKATLGRAERISFPGLFEGKFHARIDTGARKSTLWVSMAKVIDGELKVIFFDEGVVGYTGDIVSFKHFERLVVSSSNGQTDNRYTIKTVVLIGNRKIRATFTLADRSTQVYPILIGRNVLRGRFIVDVELGKPLVKKEKARIDELQKSLINKETI